MTADTDVARSGGRLWQGLTLQQKQVVWAWGFLAVPILFYGLIRFYPTVEGFIISTTNWNLMNSPSYVGLANFKRLMADPVFWQVFRNTFLYLIIGTPLSLVLAFTIAYHLDRVRFMHGFIRALYFLPFLTTATAMAWVWRWFYQPVPIGLINDLLSSVGLSQQPFLRSTTQALPAVLAPAIWAGLGFQVVIFLAGLRAIPTTYYEAARIDGVSDFAILRKITLPLLKPTIIFLVVFSSIGFLRIFDQVYNMTSGDPGGPLNATKPLVLMIYQTAFSSFDMGYAAAQTVVLFLVLLSISLVQLRLLRDR
ncbi:Carbohydrate ABC transporter membrane protein 1, CUT1 family [Bosea sp. 62]|uniref:carbohydrate ABC transporter permease n=1 Tax=unclassified Bosea (in: a-proteobacteria) TaxID=2653178 RepID=UPI001256C8DA|nr:MULTISPECIES: sugar ABC transporter permease [unclassified Bosea (in: a-proteobacteria)]CAD5253040.1 Carbohydrate ABC transporter membrane protein 1, CUT1 family [Bosea sp. 46]CAD5257713.1 Carbohydrate ABC transporter membrane protein 1, CUT1 family [Bosea sp. 21B]CAD5283212.1 Carbohydrate ABC transporter membrane protein 1, CUT1 family [Bosea sp. 7B]VVT52172.1 Carbohydrate ABC transporter membrane protein 1, CUT1 family [Bosea sp. EC-HK365B]VXB37600.1 Carbohydrate ABC transporter membrane 